MGNSPLFKAVFIGQDGLSTKELGHTYLVQVDVEVSDGKTERLFVDITTVVSRAKANTLPGKGEYYLDASEGWFEKYGGYRG